ncbi:carboxyl-terminal processing protease [Oikeobacillus pervagus]|uniref:Carboxyl-terminal processing protease n=1 Tax=Oikeobacillus pervagus TaxID=1325931 RepID=A0AAJ1T056_9BACI|nr:S41 family peptidase [Oikeobacillus pervagus]MDQ0214887.1 carboxyl-terminal processing protease [Oikeobacillus pervagus]
MKRRWIAVVAACSFLTGAGGTYVGVKTLDGQEQMVIPNEQQKESYKLPDELHKVQTAYDLISDKYVEKIKSGQLVEGAIKGMLTALEDPYSVYMDAETVNHFNDSLESSFEGIGAEITEKEGKILIVSPFKDSPAEKAGLKPHDQIIKINGKNVQGYDVFKATKLIRGKKGTTVTLSILREGLSKPINVEVKRDKIPIDTVYAKIKSEDQKKIGYIQITSFAEKTGKDFTHELRKLEEMKIEGLLIDVRGNPGGLLPSVEEILRELLSDNKPYLQIEERSGAKVPFSSTKKKGKEYPITVLIDEGSASASEILAGALKEAGHHTLIGQKTFGKGTVQQSIPLGDGSNIKLTTYKWLTPDGNWIHHKGIKPTIKVKQPNYFYAHPLQIDQPLKKEMNNDQVKNAQEMLKGLGYGPGRTDGYFSDQTVKAVKAFQIQNKLKVTGEIDSKTAERIELKIIETVKKEENDLQLQTALKYITQLSQSDIGK